MPAVREIEIVVAEGLVLRHLRLESAQAIFNVVNRNRQYLRQWLPFVDNTWKVEDTEMFIKSVLTGGGPKRDLVLEIWHLDQFAGLIALKEIDRWNKKTEIGYWLDPDLENKGIMTQCCKAMIECAFKKMALNRIQIKVGIGNVHSSRIPEKLGFRFEGIERNGEKFPHHYVDLEVYSMLRKDWDNGMAR